MAAAGGVLAATTGRGTTCRHHYRPVTPRRAVSTDRLLAGKEAAAGVELVSSSPGHGVGDGAASPDLLPGSDLESLVNTASR